MASTRRLQAIAGESEREPVSDIVAVGTIVHELDIEPLLLVVSDEDSLSLVVRESDSELVMLSVAGRLDVAVEENVFDSVELLVAPRVFVSAE